MSHVADSTLFNGNLANAVNHLLHHFPESIEKMVFPSHSHSSNENNKGIDSIPADILETEKEYTFYLDVPGLSKTDIQVTVEDENTLVIRAGGKRKRKRDDEEDEGCKYVRLERKVSVKLLRKFRLPETCNVNAISAKCENGVLTITVQKLPPPSKSKMVEVKIS